MTLKYILRDSRKLPFKIDNKILVFKNHNYACNIAKSISKPEDISISSNFINVTKNDDEANSFHVHILDMSYHIQGTKGILPIEQISTDQYRYIFFDLSY